MIDIDDFRSRLMRASRKDEFKLVVTHGFPINGIYINDRYVNNIRKGQVFNVLDIENDILHIKGCMLDSYILLSMPLAFARGCMAELTKFH